MGTKFNWDKIRANLKPKFADAGITSCELSLPGCKQGLFLSFAHSKKRRDIYTQEDMEKVILTCQSCHHFIEVLGNRKIFTMEEIVERVIEIEI